MKILFKIMLIIVNFSSSCISYAGPNESSVSEVKMKLLDDIKTKYRWAQGKTDLEIADILAQKTNQSLALVAWDLGIQMPDAPGAVSSFQNSMYGLAKGVGQLAGDFVPGVGNNNALELYGRSGTQRNPIITIEKNS